MTNQTNTETNATETTESTETATLPVYTDREQAIDNATIAYAAFHDLDTLFQAILLLSDPDSLTHKLAVAGRHIAEAQAGYFDCEREELEGLSIG